MYLPTLNKQYNIKKYRIYHFNLTIIRYYVNVFFFSLKENRF